MGGDRNADRRIGGVYDFDQPDERLRLALDQPTRARRKDVVRLVRRRYGNAAADALKEELKAHHDAALETARSTLAGV